eukprot:Gb_21352 [translate_table: standard]
MSEAIGNSLNAKYAQETCELNAPMIPVMEDTGESMQSPYLNIENNSSHFSTNHSMILEPPLEVRDEKASSLETRVQSVSSFRSDIMTFETSSSTKGLQKLGSETKTQSTTQDRGSLISQRKQVKDIWDKPTSHELQEKLFLNQYGKSDKFNQENDHMRIVNDEIHMDYEKTDGEMSSVAACVGKTSMHSFVGSQGGFSFQKLITGEYSYNEEEEIKILEEDEKEEGRIPFSMRQQEEVESVVTEKCCSRASSTKSYKLSISPRGDYHDLDSSSQSLGTNQTCEKLYSEATKASLSLFGDYNSSLIVATNQKDQSKNATRAIEERGDHPIHNNKKEKLRINLPMEKSFNQDPSPRNSTPKEITSRMLLSMGWLDGRSVRYISHRGKNFLLGTIQNGGILCHCNICKGKDVVNMCTFEKHAGSALKRPSDFIFFENGMSLHDIVEFCKGVALDMVPNVINTAIGVASKEINVCQQCGEHIYLSSQEKSHHMCSKCASDQCQPPKQQAKSVVQARDNSLHKLIFMPHGLPDGTELAYYCKGQRLLGGYKQKSGINCGCCNQVVSCSVFEAHAGWGSRRTPYNNIYLVDGRSLHEVALSLAREKMLAEGKNISPNDNEDFCTECGNGGDLLLCDGCPKAFHTENVYFGGEEVKIINKENYQSCNTANDSIDASSSSFLPPYICPLIMSRNSLRGFVMNRFGHALAFIALCLDWDSTSDSPL